MYYWGMTWPAFYEWAFQRIQTGCVLRRRDCDALSPFYNKPSVSTEVVIQYISQYCCKKMSVAEFILLRCNKLFVFVYESVPNIFGFLIKMLRQLQLTPETFKLSSSSLSYQSVKNWCLETNTEKYWGRAYVGSQVFKYLD